MDKIKVGVIRGGEGPEYDSSLEIGGYILKNLPKKYKPYDILITKKGDWHEWGAPVTPSDALRNIDVVFNIVIGTGDKEHFVQKIIELFEKPFVGSSAFAKGIAHTRHIARDILSKQGIKTPYHKVVRLDKDSEEATSEIFNSVSLPWRVRFSNKFSCDNAIEVDSYEELANVMSMAKNQEKPIIVEEYIKGENATCFIVEGTDGELRTYCIGNDSVGQIARYAHKVLGLRHFSKMDFVVSPERGAYLTSVYAHPDLYEGSPFIRQLNRQNILPSDYIDHLICLARE